MKVTYNWLKDFVEIRIAPQALAEKLTMAGLEVTSLEKKEGDFVFELEITSNRPDCLSVIGIAREVAAITNSKLKTQNSKLQFKIQNLKDAHLQIKIDDKRDCPLYIAKIICDCKVGPSPDWLRKRLELIGCRSVNNIVDITNYILFTYGEPLHAFDLDKLNSDTIVIRRAKRDERIKTIDGQERILNPEILVIGDKEKPVAIAGIIGGKETEVTENTKNLLLEAAIFNPLIIRRGRQKLGMQTESSYRFERGIDLETVKFSSGQATKLIETLTSGRCVLAKSSGETKIKAKQINLNKITVDKILGINISSGRIKGILNNLGFAVKSKGGNNFRVKVPALRQDINLEIDLIEEISRIFGYEFIPPSLPLIRPQITLSSPRNLVSGIKNILIGLGLNEVITYSLIDRDWLKDLDLSFSAPIEILNPLSKEQEILRPTIAPSLSKCVAYNLNQKQNYVNIFEVAKIFSNSSKELAKEELVLGIALSGEKSLLLEQGLIKEGMGALHLKGILETLFERLGIKNYNFQLETTADASVWVNKEKVGLITKLKSDVLDKLEIKNKDLVLAEINLERVFPNLVLERKFMPLPIYPGITRDISFILREEVKIEEILKVVREKALLLLKEVKVVDFYRGRQIPLGFKGITISCLYRADERTLTEEEITPLHSSILKTLVERFGAQIR